MALQASGYRRGWLATMGVPTGDPLTDLVNWTALNRAIGGVSPEITPNGQNDTFGMPLYATATLVYVVEHLDLSPLAALEALEAAETLVVYAMLKPDGSFEYIKNVQVMARVVPYLAKDNWQVLRIRLSASDEDQDNLIATTFA